MGPGLQQRGTHLLCIRISAPEQRYVDRVNLRLSHLWAVREEAEVFCWVRKGCQEHSPRGQQHSLLVDNMVTVLRWQSHAKKAKGTVRVRVV